jgi:hypothetical protein
MKKVFREQPEKKRLLAELARIGARRSVERKDKNREWHLLSNLVGRESNRCDQAYVLVAIYNARVIEELRIDPWAGVEKDALDERASLLFQVDSNDDHGDGLGLDSDGTESPYSLLVPEDEEELLYYISNLADSVEDSGSKTHRSREAVGRQSDPSKDELVKIYLKRRHLDRNDDESLRPYSTRELAAVIGKHPASMRMLISPRTVGRRLSEIFCDPRTGRDRPWKEVYKEACKSGTVEVFLKGVGELNSFGTVDSRTLDEMNSTSRRGEDD